MEKGHDAKADAASSRADVDEVQWKDLNFVSKCRYMINNVTVEPIGALFFMPSILAALATQNLNLEKACHVNLKYDAEVCDALTARETTNFKTQEGNVQQLVAHMMTWKNVVQSAVPAVMILFLGAWSDRHGRRKPLILLPILGELTTCLGLIICTYFFYELPMEVAGVVEGVFPAIAGGWCTMFMAIYSYIGDITTVSMRTIRIGFVSVFVHVGIPVGMALSGVLYRHAGFYGVFSTSATLYVIIFAYIYFRIKEKGKPSPDVANKSCCGAVRDLVNVSHVSETFRALQKYKGKRRAQLIMVMICGMLVIGPIHGEMAVMYLFTRYRFNWNEVDFSIFSTYSMVTNLVGTMVSVGVFSHMLKIDDALIGVMSCMSKILSCFVYAFATTTWMIYLAPIVEILNGTSFIAMRSIISKLVPPDELGKVNSLFGVCEALMPLVYGPMYSAVYASTMNNVPGAFFLLGGALTLPAVLMFLWMYMVHRREARRMQEEESTAAAAANQKSVEAAASAALQNGIFIPPSLTDGDELKMPNGSTTVPSKTTPAIDAPGIDNVAYESDETVRPETLRVSPATTPATTPASTSKPTDAGAVNIAFEDADERL